MFTLKGRTMIITGGAGNNGLAIIRLAVKFGMNVGIMSGTHAKAQGAVAKLGNECKDHIIGFAQNPEAPHNKGTYAEGITQLDVLKWICDKFGSIDVVVNGSMGHERKNMEETDKTFWYHSMEVLEGAFFNTKLALPYLKKSKAPRVINLTTCEGRNGGYDFCPSFAAARGGLLSLTSAMAKELGPKGITVNSVVIGPIEQDVPEYDVMTEEKRTSVLSRTPLGRLGVPEDVAGAVCFLASEESSFVNGAIIDVNGGLITG
ncbi:SDR family oxidoreductase [Treponema sp. TIM-1]|uniref:SDR family NAD(P)-dependent oxidoreductase n=1 Tax=Treponema sp. TIM-1 TaxID=2898417 RepID=UPI00397F7114